MTLGAVSQPGSALALLRVGIGTLGLLAPRRTQQLTLLGTDASPVVRIWTRFWATRALALGLGYLTADRHTREHLIRMGLIVDTADTAFLAAMAPQCRDRKKSLTWLMLITGASTIADLAELRTKHTANSNHQVR